MDVGHIAVEIDTQGVEIIAGFNPERYGSLKVSQKQVSEILAGRRAGEERAKPDSEPQAAQDDPGGERRPAPE